MKLPWSSSTTARPADPPDAQRLHAGAGAGVRPRLREPDGLAGAREARRGRRHLRDRGPGGPQPGVRQRREGRPQAPLVGGRDPALSRGHAPLRGGTQHWRGGEPHRRSPLGGGEAQGLPAAAGRDARILALEGLDRILGTVLSEAMGLLGAERGFIALADEAGELEPAPSSSRTFRWPWAGSSPPRSRAASCGPRSAREGRLHPQHLRGGRRPLASVLDLELRSVMCSPLRVGEKLVGVLYLDAASRPVDFDEMEQFFFGMLADHAAIAIENAKLYDPA